MWTVVLNVDCRQFALMTTTDLARPPGLDGTSGFAEVRSAFASGLRVAELVELWLPRWQASAAGIWIHRLAPDEIRQRAQELDSLGPAERERLPLFGLPFAV